MCKQRISHFERAEMIRQNKIAEARNLVASGKSVRTILKETKEKGGDYWYRVIKQALDAERIRM